MARYEILVAGPASQGQTARAALSQAGVGKDDFVPAHHGYHGEHIDPSEAWIAYRADTLEAAEADTLRKCGYRLRLHRHAERLPVQPAVQPPSVDPLEEVRAEIARLSAEVTALRAGSPLPPIGGGTLETPPAYISAAQHPAQAFRFPFQSMLSGTGVVGSGDLLVTANSPAAMNVLVAAGNVWIPGTISGTTGWGANAGAQTSVGNTNGGTSTSTGFPTSFTAQGSYEAYNDGQVTLSISSADPTNPRIDLICATVQDAEYAGSANQAVLQVVTGTAAASPSPATPPANSVVLGSVWVPAAASSITSGDINDLRPKAAPVQGGATSGTLAQRPAAGVLGRRYYATDAGAWSADNGASWNPYGGSRGAVNISTSQSTSSTTFTTLSTPDQVTGIVLPANGLIAVWYWATWQESVQGAANADIFLGSNQIKSALPAASPASFPASIGSPQPINTNTALMSRAGGLASENGQPAVSGAYGGDVTTGQTVGGAWASNLVEFWAGGPCYIFAAAGTYTVSVQFKVSSGSVTAQNRKLWVMAIPFS